MNVRINHKVVWILAVVYFLIGWGWYAIWGDTWLNLHAKEATDIERTHNIGAYVLAFVAAGDDQLRVGVSHLETESGHSVVWLEIGHDVLVRVCVHGIRDDLRILRVRNESLATHLHRHGTSAARLRDQRIRSCALAAT
jgi:hypothetical protein